MRLTRVLCPVDLSDCSRGALHYADVLASRFGADLHVVHFFLDVVPPVVSPELPIRPEVESIRQATIDALAEFVTGAGIARTTRRLVRCGLPAQGVLGYATEIDADLIVLGTHGRTGLDRALIGSTAERVLHHARCPVLTVPRLADQARTPDAGFTHILAAIDFSDASGPVVEHAWSLSRESGASFTLLHALEILSDEEARTWTEYRVGEFVEMRRQQVLSTLRSLIPTDARAQRRVNERIELGPAARTILRVAEDMSADLIVMGPQGRAGLGLMLLGSTTQTVVRRAGCPVLTVCGGHGHRTAENPSTRDQL